MKAAKIPVDKLTCLISPKSSGPVVGLISGNYYIYIYKTQSLSVCMSAIEIKLETFRYKQTYESYITFSREAKYGILISIRIVYGGLRADIYSTYINSFAPKFKTIQLQTTNRMLERFIYKRFCLNEMYANNCAHVRHFCYCRYIYRRGSERVRIACR